MSRRAWQSQRGIAAIEFAAILPVLAMLLAFSLFFGRIFWHYTVAQKAAHDAARYLASVSMTEMKAPARIANTVAVAVAITQAELEELNPGPYPPVVTIQCDGVSCDGYSAPSTVRVVVRIPMYDILFGNYTSNFTGDDGLLLTADVTMRYVGD